MKPSISALLLAVVLSCVSCAMRGMAAEHPSDPAFAEESGTLVLVFKDGHRQSFAAANIGEVEYQAASGAITRISLPNSSAPGRRRFVGAWLVGVGVGGSFTIDLDENGEAKKSMGAAHGTWSYVDGQAQVSWDDGWRDVIRKAGTKYEKFAYAPGRSLSQTPSNVTEARMKDPRPI